jgi:hypothetical protein
MTSTFQVNVHQSFWLKDQRTDRRQTRKHEATSTKGMNVDARLMHTLAQILGLWFY